MSKEEVTTSTTITPRAVSITVLVLSVLLAFMVGLMIGGHAGIHHKHNSHHKYNQYQSCPPLASCAAMESGIGAGEITPGGTASNMPGENGGGIYNPHQKPDDDSPNATCMMYPASACPPNFRGEGTVVPKDGEENSGAKGHGKGETITITPTGATGRAPR